MEKQSNGNNKTIIISGIAKAGEDTNINKQYGYLQVNVEIKVINSEIINVAANCPVPGCPGLSKLRQALIGNVINIGANKAIKVLQEEIYCINRKAVISAINDLVINYKKFRNTCSRNGK
jgi:hypothetical protein